MEAVHLPVKPFVKANSPWQRWSLVTGLWCMHVKSAHALTVVLCDMVQMVSMDTVSAELGRGWKERREVHRGCTELWTWGGVAVGE